LSSFLKHSIDLPEKITFLNAADKDIELPSAELLECHWRLAEIFNASGMAKIIEKHREDWEDLKDRTTSGHLRADGGTDVAHFLKVALWERVAW
jgi:hypothetical protein